MSDIMDKDEIEAARERAEKAEAALREVLSWATCDYEADGADVYMVLDEIEREATKGLKGGTNDN